MSLREELCEHLVAEGLAPRTVAIYLSIFERLSAQAERACLDLSSLDARQTRELADAWPLSIATRYQLRSTLMHLWASQGRFDGPLRAVRVPRRHRAHCRALSATEAALLASSAARRSDRAGLAVTIGLYEALRRAEIASLRWDAIRDGWMRILGKGSVERTIPLHPRVAERLVAFDGPTRRSAFVFPGRHGGHVTPERIWSWTREVARDAGLGDLSPHLLRHTALATANDATGDLRAVQDLAGHAKPETTAIYTRVRDARLIAALRAISYEPDEEGEPC